jgi:serine/threonine-protein kinase
MAKQALDPPGGPPDPDPEETQEYQVPAAAEPGAAQENSPAHDLNPPTPAPHTKTSRVGEIGGFRVLRQLGAGAMGKVFHARHLRTGRDVALKVLSRERARDAAFLERFQREARILAQLDNLHVVRCYGAGADRGRHFLAMEYVGGGSLQSWLDRLGKLTAADAVHVVLACARALHSAHELNLVHRDVKPENVLLTTEGVVKLADLGLAEALNDPSLTRTGTGVGTPLYMAPEQATDAKHVDGRSDIYSLGCMFYRLLTGRPPFEAAGVVAMLQAKMKGSFPPVRSLAPQTPEAVEKIVHTMMARQPEQRYQGCAELIEALEWLGLASPTLCFFAAGAVIE